MNSTGEKNEAAEEYRNICYFSWNADVLSRTYSDRSQVFSSSGFHDILTA